MKVNLDIFLKRIIKKKEGGIVYYIHIVIASATDKYKRCNSKNSLPYIEKYREN
jgi:hypothetical protein